MRLTFTPDYADAFAVQRQSMRYHYAPWQRHVWWLMLLLQAVLVTLVIWQDDVVIRLASFVLPRGLALFSPILAIALVSFAVFWIVCRWLAPRMSARWLAQRKPPLPMVVSYDDERVTWINSESERWLRWDAVERLFVTPTAVCLMHADSTAFVPLKAFEGRGGIASFIDFALAHMNDAARGLSAADKSVVRALA